MYAFVYIFNLLLPIDFNHIIILLLFETLFILLTLYFYGKGLENRLIDFFTKIRALLVP